jgi:hypothetical protein
VTEIVGSRSHRRQRNPMAAMTAITRDHGDPYPGNFWQSSPIAECPLLVYHVRFPKKQFSRRILDALHVLYCQAPVAGCD